MSCLAYASPSRPARGSVDPRKASSGFRRGTSSTKQPDKDASPRNLCPHTLIFCGIESLINSSTVMDPMPRIGSGSIGFGADLV